VAKMVRGVHDGPVFWLSVNNDGLVLSGGGKDGRLVQLNSSLARTGAEAQLAEELGGVRAVAEGRGGRLVVGTTKNCLAAGSLASGLSAVGLGHTDEVWALAVHPSLPQLATGGHDRTLRMWDAQVLWL